MNHKSCKFPCGGKKSKARIPARGGWLSELVFMFPLEWVRELAAEAKISRPNPTPKNSPTVLKKFL